MKSRIVLWLVFLMLSIAMLAPAQQYVISTLAGGVPLPIPLTPAPGLDMAIGYSRVAADEGGNVYFATSNCVFRLDRNGLVTRVAGNSRGGYSGDGGPATDAQLFYPTAIAVDGTGNLFIADSSNHRVRKVSPNGTITTVAGHGVPGFSGDGGPATASQLNYPQGLAVDGNGNVFIVDADNPTTRRINPAIAPGHRVRRVSRDGIITTVAGSGVPGYSGDGGPATSAQLIDPHSIAIDGRGNLFIGGSWGSPHIRKVSPDGLIATVVNSETSNPDCAASLIFLSSLWNAPGFCWPGAVAVDRTGNLYFTEFGEVLDIASPYYAIRKLSVDGIISTVAGNRPRGYSGDGGLAVDAQIAWSNSLAVDGAGHLFLIDGARIRKISTGGTITTVAGNGKYRPDPVDGGPAAGAYLHHPTGVAADGGGNVFIMSEGNLFLKEETAVRRVSPSGIITTVVSGLPCPYPDNWLPTDDLLPCIGPSMAADEAGNLYYVERSRVRKVSLDGTVTTVAGNGEGGYYGDGGLAVNARLSSDLYIALDGLGNLFISDGWNRRVRKVSPTGIITTVAGSGIGGWSGDGGLATKAELYPGWVAVDGAGNLFISDIGRIRKVSPNGIIDTIAGDGRLDYSCDGGAATNASGVFGPLTTDASGNLFIAVRDLGSGHCIRRISPDGVITIVAGNGTFGYTGDGGPATDAQLGFSGFRSSSVAADTWGNVYLADTFNNAIRVLRPVAAQ